jgi:hypothetical protein
MQMKTQQQKHHLASEMQQQLDETSAKLRMFERQLWEREEHERKEQLRMRQQREAEEAARQARERAARLLHQQREAEEDRRRRDPVDLFIYDTHEGTYVRVLVYSKPADDVLIFDRTLYVQEAGVTHILDITLRGKDMPKLDRSALPIYVDSLLPRK